ncbi:hypothetical protein C9374_003874 [Naegleria lovaniensis]|uniref:Inosine/uridine-preferring nucleoside hydrolase domain-containing protein n=1 Tax=Naegleria lovaniensis TaxID=51637 RepID=A0AA88H3U3_NAELO|nr:uncharacterized protein C9374_003874 [Naegleria lovaniensis]KAG2394110.1 hypothetical protein C9374_003874 [Naegleria lovaniensis]
MNQQEDSMRVGISSISSTTTTTVHTTENNHTPQLYHNHPHFLPFLPDLVPFCTTIEIHHHHHDEAHHDPLHKFSSQFSSLPSSSSIFIPTIKHFNKATCILLVILALVIGSVYLVPLAIHHSFATSQQVPSTTTNTHPGPYLWIDTDVGMDDLFAIQLLVLENKSKIKNAFQLSLVSSVYGMTSNSTLGAEIVRALLSHDESMMENSMIPATTRKVMVGSDFGLPSNIQRFRFEDSDFYDSVERKQLEFLNAMKWKMSSDPQQRSLNGNAYVSGFEPRFFNVEKDAAVKLQSLPDNSLTILALGPLTNLARWITQSKDNHQLELLLQRKVKQVVVMGGNAIFNSNDMDMEWNFHCDALSVQQVMQFFGDKFFMIGLDVANDRAVTPQQVEFLKTILREKIQVKKSDNKLSELFYKLLDINPAACTYDPITASYLIMPEMFEFEKIHAKVVLSSSNSDGGNNYAGRVVKDGSEGIRVNVAKNFHSRLYYDYLVRVFSEL